MHFDNLLKGIEKDIILRRGESSIEWSRGEEEEGGGRIPLLMNIIIPTTTIILYRGDDSSSGSSNNSLMTTEKVAIVLVLTTHHQVIVAVKVKFVMGHSIPIPILKVVMQEKNKLVMLLLMMKPGLTIPQKRNAQMMMKTVDRTRTQKTSH